MGRSRNIASGSFTNLTVTTATVNGVLTLTSTATSTGTQSGVLVVDGGVGIQGPLYGENIYMNGTLVGTGSGGGGGSGGGQGVTATVITQILPAAFSTVGSPQAVVYNPPSSAAYTGPWDFVTNNWYYYEGSGYNYWPRIYDYNETTYSSNWGGQSTGKVAGHWAIGLFKVNGAFASSPMGASLLAANVGDPIQFTFYGINQNYQLDLFTFTTTIVTAPFSPANMQNYVYSYDQMAGNYWYTAADGVVFGVDWIAYNDPQLVGANYGLPLTSSWFSNGSNGGSNAYYGPTGYNASTNYLNMSIVMQAETNYGYGPMGLVSIGVMSSGGTVATFDVVTYEAIERLSTALYLNNGAVKLAAPKTVGTSTTDLLMSTNDITSYLTPSTVIQAYKGVRGGPILSLGETLQAYENPLEPAIMIAGTLTQVTNYASFGTISSINLTAGSSSVPLGTFAPDWPWQQLYWGENNLSNMVVVNVGNNSYSYPNDGINLCGLSATAYSAIQGLGLGSQLNIAWTDPRYNQPMVLTVQLADFGVWYSGAYAYESYSGGWAGSNSGGYRWAHFTYVSATLNGNSYSFDTWNDWYYPLVWQYGWAENNHGISSTATITTAELYVNTTTGAIVGQPLYIDGLSMNLLGVDTSSNGLIVGAAAIGSRNLIGSGVYTKSAEQNFAVISDIAKNLPSWLLQATSSQYANSSQYFLRGAGDSTGTEPGLVYIDTNYWFNNNNNISNSVYFNNSQNWTTNSNYASITVQNGGGINVTGGIKTAGNSYMSKNLTVGGSLSVNSGSIESTDFYGNGSTSTAIATHSQLKTYQSLAVKTYDGAEPDPSANSTIIVNATAGGATVSGPSGTALSGSYSVSSNVPSGATGYSVQIPPGQYLSMSNPTGLNIGSATSWTVEGWFYWDGGYSYEPLSVSSNPYDSTWRLERGIWTWPYDSLDTANYGYGLAYDVNYNFPNSGQWYHVAYVNNNGVFSVYSNGFDYGHAYWGGNFTSINNYPYNTSSYPFYINSDTTTGNKNLYVYNYRISIGVARYTGNFTPTTTQFSPPSQSETIGTTLPNAIRVDGGVLINNYSVSTSTIATTSTGGTMFVWHGALYYHGTSGTVTKIANA